MWCIFNNSLTCRWADLGGEKEGFYLSKQARNGKYSAILAVEIDDSVNIKKKTDTKRKKDIMFQIYRPNTGLQVKHESLEEVEKKFKKVLSDEAEPHWTRQYDASVNTCAHSYWKGMCRYVSMGQDCEVFCLHME